METLVVFLCVLVTVFAKESPPKVEVYSRYPGQDGQPNTLICHVSNFHPPDIKIELLKDGEEIPRAVQTDLAFEQGWQFHLTKSVAFTPQPGHQFTCRVTHVRKVNSYVWDADM